MRSLLSIPWMLRLLQMLRLLGEGRLPCASEQDRAQAGQ